MNFFIRKKIVIAFLIVLLFTVVPATETTALHSDEVGWLIGKVFVISHGVQKFLSTGFVFKHRFTNYVIMTSHAIEKVLRVQGEKARFFIQLPNVEGAIPLEFVFSEPREDSAVFKIQESIPVYVIDTIYELPLSMVKNRQLRIIGYHKDIQHQHKPHSFSADFLTIASLDFETQKITLPPNLDKKDSTVLLVRCDVPFAGMSGGPVLTIEDNKLVGMVKSFGISAQDLRISERIGAEEFHVIVRLDRTMERLKKLY